MTGGPKSVKSAIKSLLRYRPMAETTEIQEKLAVLSSLHPGRPVCPAWEGDLMHALIREGGFKNCLETGFGTGSTALYMLDATRPFGGRVTSIDWSPDNFNAIGRQVIDRSGMADRHQLIERQSYLVMAEMLTANQSLDFVFVDGWKTYDYLAYECFIINRLLNVGGVIMFDDAYLPSVRHIGRLLSGHFGYEEVAYENDSWGLRLWQIATTRRYHRPYTAFRKTLATENQAPTQDWNFFTRV